MRSLSGLFPHFVHNRDQSLESVTVGESQPRKTSFILVREALSCRRPHDRAIKQEISWLKLPGMQVRPQHPNSGEVDLNFLFNVLN